LKESAVAIDTFVRVAEVLPPSRGAALRARILGATILIGATVISPFLPRRSRAAAGLRRMIRSPRICPSA
jgi:hypothetical protein